MQLWMHTACISNYACFYHKEIDTHIRCIYTIRCAHPMCCSVRPNINMFIEGDRLGGEFLAKLIRIASPSRPDMDYVSLLVALLLVSWFTIHFFLRTRHAIASKSRRSRKLPPGPYPLPIFGNLFKLGNKPHQSLAELAKTYGSVMTLQLGQLTTVIISSASMAREVLKKKDISFCNRTIVDAIRALDHDQYSMAWLPVETRWRHLRKITNSHVFSSSRLDASQGLRQKKVADLLSNVEKCCQAGAAVDIGQAAFNTVLNLLSNTFFSVDLADPSSETCQEFKKLVWQIMVEAGKPNSADYFPIMRRMDPQGIRHRLSVCFGKMINLFNSMIEDRLAEKHKHSSAEGITDTLDALLEISLENSQELDRSVMLHLLLDLFVAGTDTTSSSLEWAMTELLCNPDKMKKAQTELSEFIGKRNRPVSEADISKLPYLQAVVKETFRLHPPVPLLLPRKVDTDVDLGHFVVPKNSQVLVNAWAIGRDPTVWENPNVFEPERFLRSAIDVRGQDFELIPFGAGRRICPGLPLALRMLHLMLGSLIHSFNWKLQDGIQPETMDMDDKFGLTLQKAQPLLAIPIRV